MKTIEKTKTYAASAEAVFDCLDDLGVIGMHMTKSSLPMMGGKMNLEFLTDQRSGPHTKYRWTGKVLGWRLDFTVEVMDWVRGKKKTWATVGTPAMIIYSWFEMNLQVEKTGAGSTAYLSISYEKPRGALNRIICLLLGDWYCRWCLNNMLKEAEKRLVSKAALSPEGGLYDFNQGNKLIT